MQKNVSATANVASVTPAQVNSAGTTAVFNVIPGSRPQAKETEGLVNQLRDDVLPKSHVTSYVTGTTAATVDFSERIGLHTTLPIPAYVPISPEPGPAGQDGSARGPAGPPG